MWHCTRNMLLYFIAIFHETAAQVARVSVCGQLAILLIFCFATIFWSFFYTLNILWNMCRWGHSNWDLFTPYFQACSLLTNLLELAYFVFVGLRTRKNVYEDLLFFVLQIVPIYCNRRPLRTDNKKIYLWREGRQIGLESLYLSYNCPSVIFFKLL